jgi:anti-sigma28 factor (negative regulator of flagellin synthesis)
MQPPHAFDKIYRRNLMRIGNLNAEAVKPGVGQAAPSPPAEAGRGSGAAPDDAVTLSRLSEAVGGSGPDEARLNQLRLEVQAGTYQAPAAKIAAKIVDFHTKQD